MSAGQLERANRFLVSGWSCGDRLTVHLDGRAVGTVVARTVRADLAAAGPTARAFTFYFPVALPKRGGVIRLVVGGLDLPGSPYRVSPVPATRADMGASTGRALFVDDALPDANRDAGSQAALSHIASLRRLGLDVDVVSIVAGAHRLIDQAGQYDLVYLHRLSTMAALVDHVRAHQPRARLIYGIADLHHRREEGEAVISGQSPPSGLRAAELQLISLADCVLTHSAAERLYLRTVEPSARVAVVPWHVPLAPPVAVGGAGVGFLGSAGHAPNRDAALVLVHEIMPVLWRFAAIPCVIAGSGTAAWTDLQSDRVAVLGHVPDLSVFWAQTRVAAAPLRFGAGVKGKVLDAMAAGIPCVGTSIAAEGIELSPELRLMIADRPVTQAAIILALHRNPALHARWAALGRNYVAAHHAPEVVDAAMRRAVDRVIALSRHDDAGAILP